MFLCVKYINWKPFPVDHDWWHDYHFWCEISISDLWQNTYSYAVTVIGKMLRNRSRLCACACTHFFASLCKFCIAWAFLFKHSILTYTHWYFLLIVYLKGYCYMNICRNVHKSKFILRTTQPRELCQNVDN